MLIISADIESLLSRDDQKKNSIQNILANKKCYSYPMQTPGNISCNNNHIGILKIIAELLLHTV